MARRWRRKPVQTEIEFRSWGGARAGAGRKPNRKGKPGVSHLKRPDVKARHPQLVTMRVTRRVGNLRRQVLYEALRVALEKASDRNGMRICHFSIQSNHIHLIVEIESREALMKAMRGLSIRVARAINAHLGTGTVIADRYDAQSLTTPRRVRFALSYVLNNILRHSRRTERWRVPDNWVDPKSSSMAFDGWACEVWCPEARPPPVASPRTWLLSTGWRKAKVGPLEPLVAPGAEGGRIWNEWRD